MPLEEQSSQSSQLALLAQAVEAAEALESSFPSPLSSLERVPLQNLAISPAGSLRGGRVRTIRPIPTPDKENTRAVTQAIDHRHVTSSQRLGQLSQLSDRARRVRRRLVNNIHRFIGEGLRANPRSAARATDHPRLSMPQLDSDDASEPDLSVLGMARPGPVTQQHIPEPSYDDIDDEILSQDQYEADETSIDDEHDEDDEEDDHDATPLIDPATAGLKEISNLGKFTVSSHKSGNGVEELRSDDLKRFWQ